MVAAIARCGIGSVCCGFMCGGSGVDASRFVVVVTIIAVAVVVSMVAVAVVVSALAMSAMQRLAVNVLSVPIFFVYYCRCKQWLCRRMLSYSCKRRRQHRYGGGASTAGDG